MFSGPQKTEEALLRRWARPSNTTEVPVKAKVNNRRFRHTALRAKSQTTQTAARIALSWMAFVAVRDRCRLPGAHDSSGVKGMNSCLALS